MTPFVAAAAQRVDTDDLFALTNRLHQVMLSAAGLASKQRAQSAASAAAGDPSVSSAAGGLTTHKSMSVHPEDDTDWLQQHQHISGPPEAAAGPLSARLRRLAARKEAAQQRKQQKQLMQQAKRQRRSLRSSASGRSRQATLPADVDVQTFPWAAHTAQGHAKPASALDGWLDSGKPQQRLLVNPAQGLTGEDLTHPWSWDVTQQLTVLSRGSKVRRGSARMAFYLRILGGLADMQSSDALLIAPWVHHRVGCALVCCFSAPFSEFSG